MPLPLPPNRDRHRLHDGTIALDRPNRPTGGTG
jgi:hypothetical protein